MSSYERYKEMLTALDKADWADAEDLVLEGDANAAVEALLALVLDAARKYAKSAAVNSFDWDDIVATGNLALVEAVHGWQPGGMSLKNWCYQKVLRDIGRHVGRELGYSTQNEEELPPEHEDEPLDESPGAVHQVNDKMIREWVNENLPENEAEIVNLVYFKGVGVREIARTKGVSPEAISKIHRRVLKKLRGEVDSLGLSWDIL